MKKFISMHSNKIFYFISIILVIMIFFKTSFVNNLKNVLESSENERITKLYGYCKNESIGYLKYLKKKYDIKSNPKIINYVHTPPNKWAIYDVLAQNIDSTKLIILNYPGNEINLKLSYYKKNFYELNDPYFYSIISNLIASLEIQDSIEPNINITFYLKDRSNNFQKLKTINAKKYKDTNDYIINQTFDDFKINELRLFLKIDGLNKKSKLTVKLKNKYDLENFKILDQYQNCYFVE
tara:strand:- start:321 stop:1034 length:714 start_codon:yes stop_codon:yes gene_type:complete